MNQLKLKLKPERLALALEAKQLREFGWTLQQIGECLEIPFQSAHYWLQLFRNGNSKDIIAKYPNDITLIPTFYENTGNLIPPESIDLILTDPPYLVSSANMKRGNQNDLQRDFGEWDKMDTVKYRQSVNVWASLMAKQLKLGGSLYLFMGHKQMNVWATALHDNGLTDNGLLVWHRINPAPQIRKTRWCPAFDLILFYSKGNPRTFRWFGQNEMHSVITGGICGGNERSYHPTQKPRWLLRRLIMTSSPANSHILDPFAGSGSTAFASIGLARVITLIEPEPEYYGLIQSTAKRELKCEVQLKQI